MRRITCLINEKTWSFSQRIATYEKVRAIQACRKILAGGNLHDSLQVWATDLEALLEMALLLGLIVKCDSNTQEVLEKGDA